MSESPLKTSSAERRSGGPAVAAIAVVTKSHLAAARVLMESLARHLPEAARYVLLADRVDGCYEPGREPFETVEAEALSIPEFRRMAFHYGPMELCCALKPRALRWLLEERGFERALYLDADVLFCARPQEALDELAACDVVLTPHLCGPAATPAGALAEAHVLRDGTYNGGFVALRRSASSIGFLNWWCEKLTHDCLVDSRRGLMYDQKWLDMVPALFPPTAILREPGYNVAYWNLDNRPVERDAGGKLVAGGAPLVCFHFSFFRGAGEERPFGLSGPRRDELGGEARRLLEEYGRRLAEAGQQECAGWPYAYGAFCDGTPVHPAFREFYREVLHVRGRGAPEDPFATEGGVMAELVARWRDTPWVGAVAALYRQVLGESRSRPNVPLYDPFLFARWWLEHAEETGVGEPFTEAQRRLLEELEVERQPGAFRPSAGMLALMRHAHPGRACDLWKQFGKLNKVLSDRLDRILNKRSVRLYKAVKRFLGGAKGAQEE